MEENLPVIVLPLAPSPKNAVALAAWGSQEHGSALEDLQHPICVSRTASATPDAAHGISKGATACGLQAVLCHKSLAPDMTCLPIQRQVVAAAPPATPACDQAGVVQQHQQRPPVGGHRSLPGAPELLQPQEVLVKVLVQQRGNVDSSSSTSSSSKVNRSLQQAVLPNGKGQPQQVQQLLSPRREPLGLDQQEALIAGMTRQRSIELQGLQDSLACMQRVSSSCTASSSSSRSRSSTDTVSSHTRKRLVPQLDLTKAQLGRPVTQKHVMDLLPLTQAQAERDIELSLEHDSSRSIHLHPNAPMQDNRCYHYRAMGPQQVAAVKALLCRLGPEEAEQVQGIFDALLMARRDCEAMAARGVRVSRDISRDWQETVSDLIDRVVAQDSELGQLRQQLKTAQATANSLLPTSNGSTSGGLQNLYGPVSSRAGVTGRGGGGSCSGGSASCSGNHNNSNNNNLEDLHGQVIRLKRHRDRLMQSHQDISKELADTKGQLAHLQQQAQELHKKHVTLLQQHIELAGYAEGLEASTADSKEIAKRQLQSLQVPPLQQQPPSSPQQQPQQQQQQQSQPAKSVSQCLQPVSGSASAAPAPAAPTGAPPSAAPSPAADATADAATQRRAWVLESLSKTPWGGWQGQVKTGSNNNNNIRAAWGTPKQHARMLHPPSVGSLSAGAGAAAARAAAAAAAAGAASLAAPAAQTVPATASTSSPQSATRTWLQASSSQPSGQQQSSSQPADPSSTKVAALAAGSFMSAQVQLQPPAGTGQEAATGKARSGPTSTTTASFRARQFGLMGQQVQQQPRNNPQQPATASVRNTLEQVAAAVAQVAIDRQTHAAAAAAEEEAAADSRKGAAVAHCPRKELVHAAAGTGDQVNPSGGGGAVAGAAAATAGVQAASISHAMSVDTMPPANCNHPSPRSDKTAAVHTPMLQAGKAGAHARSVTLSGFSSRDSQLDGYCSRTPGQHQPVASHSTMDLDIDQTDCPSPAVASDVF